MPTLDSYTDPKDPLNVGIYDRLSPGRPGGSVVFLHLGGSNAFTGTTLNTGMEYPFTALGRIGVRVATRDEGRLIDQMPNRFNPDTGPKSSAQLVLLDTADQDEIARALKRDAKQTRRDDPYAAQSLAWIAANKNDADLKWLVANKLAAQRHLNRTAMSNEVNTHLRDLRDRNQPLFMQMYQWLVYGDNGASPRAAHHEARSALKLRSHYANLRDGLTNQAQTHTEARGEYAASKILITVFQEQFQLKMGKAAGGGRKNGIDQIWVKRDPLTGDVQEYLVVEAKGSSGAEMGHPADGQQMSPRWLFRRLLLMAQGTNKNFVDADTSRVMPQKILRAMFDDARKIRVRGIVFHALYGTANEGRVVQMTDLGDYNQPEVVTLARQNSPVFGGPVVSGMSLDSY